MKDQLKKLLGLVAVGWLCWAFQNGLAQTTVPPSSNPDLQEVVRLSKQHLSDDLISNFIKNSGKTYKLSADDIIYLDNEGISQPVISALQQAASAGVSAPPPESVPPQTAAPQATPPPVEPAENVPPATTASTTPQAPPPTEGGPVNFQYFHDQLAPWGNWVDVPGLGPCWQPGSNVTGLSPDWRPYYDNGQWIETENGYFWQSDYVWGDIPFHYGRWILNPAYGWIWLPDYTWGPAWVFWRQGEADSMVGWAPLPPGAVFIDGFFWFHGARVGLDFDFGLGESCFVFVDVAHFHERIWALPHRPWRYEVGRGRIHEFYAHSVIRNEFRRDDRGRFVNNGIGREPMQRLNNHVEQARLEERHPVGDRNRLEAEHGRTPGNIGGADRRPGGAEPQSRGQTGGQVSRPENNVNKVYRPPVTTSKSGRGEESQRGDQKSGKTGDR